MLPAQVNDHALASPRVRVITQDAFVWLQEAGGVFDFAVVDSPDPTNSSLGKLYTTAFYRLRAREERRRIER